MKRASMIGCSLFQGCQKLNDGFLFASLHCWIQQSSPSIACKVTLWIKIVLVERKTCPHIKHMPDRRIPEGRAFQFRHVVSYGFFRIKKAVVDQHSGKDAGD